MNEAERILSAIEQRDPRAAEHPQFRRSLGYSGKAGAGDSILDPVRSMSRPRGAGRCMRGHVCEYLTKHVFPLQICVLSLGLGNFVAMHKRNVLNYGMRIASALALLVAMTISPLRPFHSSSAPSFLTRLALTGPVCSSLDPLLPLGFCRPRSRRGGFP